MEGIRAGIRSQVTQAPAAGLIPTPVTQPSFPLLQTQGPHAQRDLSRECASFTLQRPFKVLSLGHTPQGSLLCLLLWELVPQSCPSCLRNATKEPLFSRGVLGGQTGSPLQALRDNPRQEGGLQSPDKPAQNRHPERKGQMIRRPAGTPGLLTSSRSTRGGVC